MTFFWRGAQEPLHHTHPLDAYGTSHLLTEILNTPLISTVLQQLTHANFFVKTFFQSC